MKTGLCRLLRVGGKMSAAGSDCQLTVSRPGRVPFRTTGLFHSDSSATLNYILISHSCLFELVYAGLLKRQASGCCSRAVNAHDGQGSGVRIGTCPSLSLCQEKGSRELHMNHHHEQGRINTSLCPRAATFKGPPSRTKIAVYTLLSTAF